MIDWQSYITAPPGLKPLLEHRGSFTQLMQDHGEFELCLLRQDWTIATDEELQYLGLHSKKIVSREVVLSCDGHPWMYAKTLFPPGSLIGPGEIFKTLGTTSLGNVLFQDPTLKRSAFEFAELDRSTNLFQRAQQYQPDATRLWARRSIFNYHNLPLAVVEVFYEHPSIKL